MHPGRSRGRHALACGPPGRYGRTVSDQSTDNPIPMPVNDQGVYLDADELEYEPT